jgi:invasion protein IalB
MISLKTKVACVAGFAGLVLTGVAGMPGFVSTPAMAQAPKPATPPAATPAPPAAPPANAGIRVPLKAAQDQGEWLKVCGEDPTVKKTVCYTTRDFVAENNQPVMAVAMYAIKEDNRRFVRILVPLTFLIPPGVRFAVEGAPAVNAKFQICLQQGCFVEAELNDTLIGALKKGTTLRIDMQNQIGQEVNFEVPLGGFGKAFDSAGIDQEALARLQQGVPAPGAAPAPGAEDLKKKGEELLKQRQQQGGQAPKP